MRKEWESFNEGVWCDEINVRDFILKNLTVYEGDDSFLAQPTEATKKLNKKLLDLNAKERANGGVLDADTSVVSTLTSHGAGYIDRKLEKIVGLQTDKPLKRALHVFGGIRTSENALKAYGYQIDPEVKRIASSLKSLTLVCKNSCFSSINLSTP